MELVGTGESSWIGKLLLSAVFAAMYGTAAQLWQGGGIAQRGFAVVLTLLATALIQVLWRGGQVR